jgi:hypothetical protein
MLTRQLLRAPRALPAAGSAIRTFSTTQKAFRTPSLADLEPEKHDDFISRQKKFREQLAEAQKQREASALSSLTQSQAPSESTESTDSSVDSTTSSDGSSRVSSYSRRIFPDIGQGLGSLSTTRGGTTGNAAASKTSEPSRKAGPLTNLIYGTKEGREMDAQIEASFSQVLARGKYVHSIVFHEVKPDCVDEYVELVGNWYPKMAGKPENKVHLVGSWRTEVGDCDTFGESGTGFPHALYHR